MRTPYFKRPREQSNCVKPGCTILKTELYFIYGVNIYAHYSRQMPIQMEPDDNCPGCKSFHRPLNSTGLNPEENRPPAELFAWGHQRPTTTTIRDRGDLDPASPDSTSPPRCTPSLEPTRQEFNNGLPGIRRSSTAAGGRLGTAKIGVKRKGLATTGGEGEFVLLHRPHCEGTGHKPW